MYTGGERERLDPAGDRCLAQVTREHPPCENTNQRASLVPRAQRRLYDAIIWLFIFPDELISDWFGVTKDENRDLVRMLVNSLFWIGVVVVGLAIWTSRLPMYQ